MAKGHVESNKKYLSHTLAEWACGLKYEHLSAKAIETAKLFWYDSLGCALGGSQTEDAKILLEHHREMSGKGASGSSTCFVSGFRTNPVDAAF
jgi:2-methylcitrate dehydratase PrpD